MEHEDTLRAAFSVLRGEVAPPTPHSAARVILRGRAVRSRRRTAAVVGSAVAAAGIAVLALALLPSAPAEPGPSLQPPSSTNSEVVTTPTGVTTTR
ncbi:hypothetical protein [Lentzea sp. NPDC059081]|uniref:hypothetical protein n=1 Tax=Lentzea sp. NPDC059081 TaxID=3346719 RepID=UPI0036898335